MESLRYAAIALNLVCLLAWVWLVRIHPPLWPSVCLPLAVFLHTIIFYAVAIDRAAPPSIYLTTWSNGLRVHESLTWLIGGLLMGRALARAKKAGGNE